MNSNRRTSRIAGLAYVIIIVAGIFAEFFVRSGLVVPGDAAATAQNITASEALFRAGFVSDIVMLLFDVVVALALYVLLKPVNRALALLAALFRVTHTAILGINTLNHFFALLLLSGEGYLGVFNADQLHALVLLFLDAHGYGYLIAQVFFGLHCAVIGYLIFRSGYIPKMLGVLLFAAAFGYLTESFTLFLFPGHEVITYPGLAAAVIAEVSLCLWLLLKGVDERAYVITA